MASSEQQEWLAAMTKEINQLEDQGTWTPAVPPRDRKPIGTRWLFAKKTDSAGNVVRYKARLVCRGFAQVHGQDYTETTSPVVTMTTLRTVLAYAVANDYCVEQADADNAYVQATLSEEIYVEAPVGFDSGGPVLRLIKALYGLKHAGRAWYMHSTVPLCARLEQQTPTHLRLR